MVPAWSVREPWIRDGLRQACPFIPASSPYHRSIECPLMVDCINRTTLGGTNTNLQLSLHVPGLA